ncbi:hypothetical protein GCM10010171_12710 [Actinokineospora fastidiosa]|uniref:Uncharacterized protein n=1 Tax=Actinokineospora fastidiosa TaxID=1816 RepID=A0A918L8N4_9PSEU|nr:hypothetical protein GCM10010171_12710 [Actinokineospora fastidiosa]
MGALARAAPRSPEPGKSLGSTQLPTVSVDLGSRYLIRSPTQRRYTQSQEPADSIPQQNFRYPLCYTLSSFAIHRTVTEATKPAAHGSQPDHKRQSPQDGQSNHFPSPTRKADYVTPPVGPPRTPATRPHPH